jgi:hypothetical protein
MFEQTALLLNIEKITEEEWGIGRGEERMDQTDQSDPSVLTDWK